MTVDERKELAAAVADELAARGLVRPRAALVGARELAETLGLSSTSFVYENWKMLGGVRLGDGPGARLRFDIETSLAALRRRDEPRPAPWPPAKPRPRRGRSRSTSAPADLIAFD